MIKQKTMEFDSKEYHAELQRRFKEGGTIWLIERTDTHEFYVPDLSPHIHVFGKGYQERHCQWSNEIGIFTVSAGFLTEEDANQHSWLRGGFERGCPKCGHGGIPIKFAEHEFVR